MKKENAEVMIKAEDLRQATDEELEQVIEESTQKLHEMRSADMHGNKWIPKKPHLIKAHKKLIARANTILRERY